MTPLEIGMKLAYEHYEAESCKMADADKLAHEIARLLKKCACSQEEGFLCPTHAVLYDKAAELANALLQIDELKKCADSYHTAKGCCRALASHQAKTEKRKDEVCDSCGWNNGPDCGAGSRVMYTVGKVTKCGSCLSTTRNDVLPGMKKTLAEKAHQTEQAAHKPKECQHPPMEMCPNCDLI